MEKQQKKTSPAEKNSKKTWLTLLLNLLLALIILVFILLGVWGWLRSYTHHGEEINVPNLVGLYMPEAEPIAQTAAESQQAPSSLLLQFLLQQLIAHSATAAIRRTFFMTLMH